MKNIFLLLRIKHWTKNLICFAGIIFGGELYNINYWILSFGAFISFCFISSFVYVLNDIIDKDLDKYHYRKKYRPIPNGDISVEYAIFIGSIALSIGLVFGWLLGASIFLIILFYIFNNILYSFFLKKLPIIDVFSISLGFILRMMSGVYVIGDLPTTWITICTMFLALFLGFSKRFAEKISIKNNNHFNQRFVLTNYKNKDLISLVNETSFGSVLSYALSTTVSGKNPALIITIPIVYYAITYYKFALFNGKLGEEPETTILKDKTIQVCIVLWLIMIVLIIYHNPQFFL